MPRHDLNHPNITVELTALRYLKQLGFFAKQTFDEEINMDSSEAIFNAVMGLLRRLKEVQDAKHE
jgi:hypothetical protein